MNLDLGRMCLIGGQGEKLKEVSVILVNSQTNYEIVCRSLRMLEGRNQPGCL